MVMQNKEKKMIEKIYVVIDDESIEATGEVLEQLLFQRKKYADDQIMKAAEAEAKASAKSALLAKLGITQDEANLLLS
jgi:hypothetical protein